jgi:hypothetical protein
MDIVLSLLRFDLLSDLRDMLVPRALHIAPRGRDLVLACVHRLAELLRLGLSRLVHGRDVLFKVPLALALRVCGAALGLLGPSRKLPQPV